MILTITGSGTSGGVPEIGCACAVCRSANPKDNRLRASAIVQSKSACIVIDPGPDFRSQALRHRMMRLTAVLVTHAHSDHIQGLNDVRPFCKDTPMPLYANGETIAGIKETFGYMFRPAVQKGGGIAKFTLTDCACFTAENPLMIDGMRIVPVPLKHGILNVSGWRINDTAYLTDVSEIPESSYPLLTGIKTLVIDGLRMKKHQTHVTFIEALAIAERTSAQNVYLTHIAHDYSHDEIASILKARQAECPLLQHRTVAPAYDGLVLNG